MFNPKFVVIDDSLPVATQSTKTVHEDVDESRKPSNKC